MSSVSRRTFVTTTAAAAAAHAADFQSSWPADVSRPWLGADYWANPMQDWRIRNGRLECFVAGGDRNVYLLTRELSTERAAFVMSVRIGRLEPTVEQLGQGFAGFRTGIRGQFDDYRDSAVHGVGVNAGVTGDGMLFIADPEVQAPRIGINQQNLQMRLSGRPNGDTYTLLLEVLDETGAKLAELTRRDVPREWVRGGVGLVCSSGQIFKTPHPPVMTPSGQDRRDSRRGGTMRFWFRDWRVSGPKVVEHSERAHGPILFALHTLSRRVMKMTAQFTPLDDPKLEVQLQTRQGDAWRTVARSGIDASSRTAHFRIANWDDTKDTAYRLLLAPDHTFEGTIRKDPRDQAKIVVGALTCANDFAFPHNDIVRGLRHFRPDILLFTGDQIYERVGGYGNQMEPTAQAELDYLRKWYIFGWAFRDVLRDTPMVALPDDHDVYHGNIWGAGGKRADPTGDPDAQANRNQALQDSGGFKMPADWVNMVQRTQTAHLPDPADPTPVEQGITVYYTSLLYGGANFAIIEDRKWKSAPRTVLPWASIRNGWAQNARYNGARDGDVAGAELLGKRQMAFLEKWAADWSDGTWMKAVVSQTIWANLCTLPAPANTDSVSPRLPILRPGQYPEGEVSVCDHDSNGWPQTPRTNALRLMRKAMAFHVGGDQHLGSTVQYGIDGWNDGPFVICTPAVSNLFPRRWYPARPGANRAEGTPPYCGEHVDGFGNKITVHAVANPQQFGIEPSMVYNRAPGYGIIELERSTRRITLTNWPRWVDPARTGARPYLGWPVTIDQTDNTLRAAAYELRPVDALADQMVLQVWEESSNELVYSLRLNGRQFTPRVFREGKYTVRLVPDKGNAVEWKGLVARKRGSA